MRVGYPEKYFNQCISRDTTRRTKLVKITEALSRISAPTQASEQAVDEQSEIWWVYLPLLLEAYRHHK